jgi:hypothetical protein
LTRLQATEPLPWERKVFVAIALAAVHFGASLGVGVLAFIAQGNLTDPGPPSFLFRVLSSAAAVLEFPLVLLVRVLSPERHSFFFHAALANSLLWGAVLYAAVWAPLRRRRAVR